jgi:hypothetical protein
VIGRGPRSFQQSFDLAPRPLTLYNLAAAQMNVGRLVDASENFRRFLRETSPGEQEQFREEATRSRVALEERIPFARIRIDGLAQNDSVSVDGVALPRAVLASSLPLDPGAHVVEVTRDGSVVAREEFELDEAESRTVSLTVSGSVPSPDAVAVAAEPERATGDSLRPEMPADDDEGGGVFSSAAFWIVTTVILLAAGAGVAAYFLLQEEEEPFPASFGSIDFR